MTDDFLDVANSLDDVGVEFNYFVDRPLFLQLRENIID